MSFTTEIVSYQLVYYAKRSRTTHYIAHIALYNDRNQSIGNVYFYKGGITKTKNSSQESYTPKRVYLRMHESQLDSVVDMLRNEKPCYVHYSSTKVAYLYTGTEPIGEEESEDK